MAEPHTVGEVAHVGLRHRCFPTCRRPPVHLVPGHAAHTHACQRKCRGYGLITGISSIAVSNDSSPLPYVDDLPLRSNLSKSPALFNSSFQANLTLPHVDRTSELPAPRMVCLSAMLWEKMRLVATWPQQLQRLIPGVQNTQCNLEKHLTPCERHPRSVQKHDRDLRDCCPKILRTLTTHGDGLAWLLMKMYLVPTT